jgi:bifunctional UDP-N-acetylglucosamine pyrophosphorylase/glucosamine-1-phosphate N-acetyltransferase
MIMSPGKTTLSVLILAAGQGTRMKSSRPKMLHEISGRWMVLYALDTVYRLKPAKTYLLLGHRAEEIRDALQNEKVRFLLQKEQKGTGHAVLCAVKAIPKKDLKGTLLVINGDAPLLTAATLGKLVKRHDRSEAALSLLTCRLDHPFGYGRLVRDPQGRPQKIVEEKNASEEQKRLNEVNAGMYCLSLPEALPMLKQLRPAEKTGELYITDLLAIALGKGLGVSTVSTASPEEIMGVNSRQDLSAVQKILWQRKARKCMASGVTLLAPDMTYIDQDAVIGPDTVIHPGVTISGRTVVGKACTIGSGASLSGCSIGDRTTISAYARISGARINRGGRKR